jgi:hypothetical protein
LVRSPRSEASLIIDLRAHTINGVAVTNPKQVIVAAAGDAARSWFEDERDRFVSSCLRG